MSEILITEMTKEDLTEVVVLEEQIFSMPWSKQGFLDSLVQKDTLYLTARMNGIVVGYCGFLQSLEEADITNVAVSEKARRCHVAETMLQKLMKLGRERGIRDYTLEVRKSNLPAICLYEKLGFVSVGVRPHFYEKPIEDAVIMWKYGIIQ